MNRIEFSDEEIQELIEQNITGPHKDLLCEAIFGLVGDYEWRMELLFKASLGSKPKCILKLHEEYLIASNVVSTYEMDSTLTEAAGLLDAKGKFKCTLIEFLPWENAKYRISYTYLKSDGAKYPRTYEISPNYLEVYEEFPEDVAKDSK